MLTIIQKMCFCEEDLWGNSIYTELKFHLQINSEGVNEVKQRNPVEWS